MEKAITKKTIVVPASVEYLESIQSTVSELLEVNKCPLKVLFNINIAIEEIFVNIASYAYSDNTGEVQINISIYEKERKFSITFIDNGIPFNPLNKEEADITLSAEDREIGGLGILMVKRSMDNIEYVYENCQNKLTIEKQF